MDRRDFLQTAAALGAALACGHSPAGLAKPAWTERRDLYPQGVASGDPHPDSVLLWTRRPPVAGSEAKALTLQVSGDPQFRRIVASTTVEIAAASDWTCRVLAAGLKPARVYWYRFTDEHGFGSRVGRTITAPAANDTRTVHFTFVSCQNVCQGAQNTYRRMSFEDERRPRSQQLNFVLHLGDFIYENTWYPEDRPQGMYGRRLRDLVRFKNGEKIRDFHIPGSLDDFRALYRAYLQDPDLQDARARWPFVCMFDNHEFSWRGFQGFMKVGTTGWPAQTRKVAANQAWFEYQPARVMKAGRVEMERFEAPAVAVAPVSEFDANGLGMEPNNIAAINSLIAYRRLRFGRHVDLILTDNRSFQTEAAVYRTEVNAFRTPDFPYLLPEEVVEIFDAGRTYNGGQPPDAIRFGEQSIANPFKGAPAHTMLGVQQKAWFLEQLSSSQATWKIWGSPLGTLDYRTDPQNLPAGMTKPWPGAGYASFDDGDWSAYRVERAEIFDFIRDRRIPGFATVAGDRHSFWAGLASKQLPPHKFEPVGVEFITGAISSTAVAEGAEHNLAADHPLRSIYVHKPAPNAAALCTMNLLLKHGVRSCLELVKSGDLRKALELSNAEMSPHLSFIDMGGHGYGLVSAGQDALETEFVCIPRPLERSTTDDGGPLLYRVRHRAELWKPGEPPKLERTLVEGNLPFSI